jgi:hypothetical protein
LFAATNDRTAAQSPLRAASTIGGTAAVAAVAAVAANRKTVRKTIFDLM